MGLKQKAISLAAEIFSLSPVSKQLTTRYGGQGVILMFHGISPSPHVINKAGNVSVVFFENILRRIQSAGLEPVRLVDLPARLKSRPDKRFVALTFDDGYKSTLDLAVPLLEIYKIPATVFITSGALTGKLNYYWGALEEYLRSNDSIAVGGLKFPTRRLEQKQHAYREITKWVLKDPDFWSPRMEVFFKNHKIDFKKNTSRDFLNAEGVRAINRSGMIDVGGHTVSHPVLSKLNEKEALAEIKSNKGDLEKLLGHTIDCFAYPFGNNVACGEREFALAKKAGYKLAVTTNCMSVSDDNLYALPRFSVSGLYETEAVFDLYLNGAWAALRSLAISKN